jgi:phosphoserine phosphatase RsbU/P
VKILAVDDEPTSRRILEAGLAQLGHSVRVAPGGDEALALHAADRASLVVTDWLMPGMDGLELTRRLRADARGPYTYVLLITGVEGRKNWLTAMESGIDDFLSKPIDLDVLRARVRVAERILGLITANRTLARFIPICMYCKKARTDRDYWLDLDRYLTESGDAQLSHGVCPDCNAREVQPMLEKFYEEQRLLPPDAD